MPNNDFGFQWHITDRCPGRCRHCYQSGFDGAAEMPVEGLMRVADCVMRAGGGRVSVNVTGGEPLLYGGGRGVFELMEYLSTFDNLDELNIITAAYGMDSVIVDKLKSLPKLTNVKVSLESHDSLINDYLRGDGHYKMAVRNISALTQAGLSVVIMATLSRHNYRSVEGLCKLAGDIGAGGVIFERYVPLGRGLEMRDSVLVPDEWIDVLRAICCVSNTGSDISADIGVNADIIVNTDTNVNTGIGINSDNNSNISITDLLPYKAFFVGKDFVSGALCCLGPSSMALMPDGTVYPCRRVPVPIGKLPDDGMGRVFDILNGYSSAPQKCFDFGC